MRHLVLVVLLSIITHSALGQIPVRNRNCPWINPRVSWVTYLTKEVNRPRFASIQFLKSGHVPDREIWKGRCFTAEFDANAKKWSVSGYYRDQKYHQTTEFFSNNTSQSKYFHEDKQKFRGFSEPAMFADPRKFRIQVRGGNFIFNEGGEVVHKKYGVVGYLRCHLPSHRDPCVARPK